MSAGTGITAPVTPATPATLAKGALRRLAAAQLEPTPANFARAYAEEAGSAAPEQALPASARPLLERLAARVSDDAALRTELVGALLAGRPDALRRALDQGHDEAAARAEAWAALIEKVARGLERGSRQWTLGRKKESLQRVLAGSRSGAQRLQQRLSQLVAAWDEGAEPPAEAGDSASHGLTEAPGAAVGAALPPAIAPDPAPKPGAPTTKPPDATPEVHSATHHADIETALHQAVRAGLPPTEPRAAELADELSQLAARIAAGGASAALAAEVAAVCGRAERLFAHRHHLVDELMALCRSLTAGLTELAEDGSWAQGQGEAVAARLDDGAGARAVHAARELLDQSRAQQRHLRVERDQARDALKSVVQSMLSELGQLGDATGRFSDHVTRYAEVIAQADTLESLTGVVREMVGETRAVHQVVAGARERLSQEHSRASELEGRVRDLEAELRRLSDEVSTDVLTQVANRRGMAAAFEAERARVERGAGALAVGLIDIDNFKRLNDTLGHAAGDVALKSLAARVKEWLRPVDHVARFGGEEFVVLLPETPVAEAQQVLTRLQRRLSASLFMHEGKEVFVTFSAGVTPYRAGEALDAALERADEALYEAKRTGKNRTCVA